MPFTAPPYSAWPHHVNKRLIISMPNLHRAFAAAAVVAFSMVLLCGCGSPETRRANHMKRGQAYLAGGQLDKALVEFRNVLQIAPGDISARVMIGHVAERQGSFREAFGDYRAAVDLDPENPIARASLARIYVFADEPQTALELVEPTLLRFPNDPELLAVRGAARAELKDPEEAFQDAHRAVQIAPTNANAVALLASLYKNKGEGENAVALLKSTLQAVPSSIELRQILSSLYTDLNEPGQAEEQLIEIVKIAPKDFEHRYKLAQFYVRQKRIADAGRVLEQALDVRRGQIDARLAYVEFLSTYRSPAEGQRMLARFISRDRKNYDLQLGFGALQQKNGETQEALATYRRIVADAGERPQALGARNRIAAILVAQGQSSEALALVNEVLQKSPRDNDALILKGNIELDKNDTTAAIADLRAVLHDQPDDVPILRSIARAHLANGEPGLAEESLRSAVKAAPKDVGVRIDLAQLLMQSNRFASAVAMLEETVLEAPTDLAAREALANAYLGAKDLPDAGRAAQDLKTVAPKRAIGWYLAGLVAQSQNQLDDAQSQLERAAELEPGATDALTALVRLDVKRGRLQNALARANAAIAARPSDPVRYNILGELYLASRDYPKSIEALTRATQLGPRLWLAYRNLALAQLATGNLKGATATYETALRVAGLNPTLVVDLAALYERQGQVDAAIRVYETLHDRSPWLQIAANNLAMLLVTYHKDRASLDHAQELTADFDRSDNPSLLDTQGWVRYKAGDFVEAIAELQAAAAHAPNSRIIRYHLGMAQLEVKRFAEARANLEAALQDNQPFAGAEEARAALAKLGS